MPTYDVSQTQLAKAVGVSQKWLSSIELGKETAQLGKVLQVLSFLGVRLQVGEAPWLMFHERRSAKSKQPKTQKVSLADIIAAHADADAPARKRKAKR